MTTLRTACISAAMCLACHSSPPISAAVGTIASDVPASSRGCRTPVAQRESEAGCFLTLEVPAGSFDASSVYWHLYTYPAAVAAEGARGTGTVVHSFGRHWVYTFGPRDWRAASGTRVASIGPLSVEPDRPYTARYMEAVFPEDYRTPPVGHRHSGAEAWYVLEGGQCLETPDSVIHARAGQGAVVPSGPPMSIAGYGPGTRKAVLLVLHPADQPWVSQAPDWTPTGKCGR